MKAELEAALRTGRYALALGTEEVLRDTIVKLCDASANASQQLFQHDEIAEMSRIFGPEWEDASDMARHAIKHEELDVLRVLFDHGFNLKGDESPLLRVPLDSCTTGGIGSTWLSHAAAFSWVSAMRFFIDRGAALEARDIFKDTVLLSAAREGKAGNCALLIAAGADVRAVNICNSNALHLAVLDGDLTCVQVLVRAGVPLYERASTDACPPIMGALQFPNPPVLRYLIDAGAADFTLRTGCREMNTLLALALRPSAREFGNVTRQIVVEEAYRRELAQRGTGDPDGLLGLYGAAVRSPQRCFHAFAASGCCIQCDHAAANARLALVPASDAALPPKPVGAQLPQRGRVLRYPDGASVAQPSELAPSQFVAPLRGAHLPRLLALLMATHPRLGADSPARMLPRDAAALIATLITQLPRSSCAQSCADGDDARCACVVAQQPCFLDCPADCRRLNPLNALSVGGRLVQLSDCAVDHLDTVTALSDVQLRARYGLACVERWGSLRQHCSSDGADAGPTVALKDVLSDNDAACGACGRHGAQAFSFCLNRAVNIDRVKHCLCCGKCFYFRPGALPTSCPYCERNPRGHGAPVVDLLKTLRDTRGVDTTADEGRMAAHGYWGR